MLATLVLLASLPVQRAAAAQVADTLEEIIVTGVRASEQRSVELKRGADVIQDSISAEDIGKLPDTTIADSLQRITGVQINRVGGEGTSVNIRGLPQVGTLLNGEAFLTTGSIVSVQPDFGDIPSQLFAGADVSKSSTASLLDAGITGTINLKTRRPYDLQQGWTLAGAASALHGSKTDKYQPELDALIGYHAERWGFVLSGAYSDVTLEHSFDGVGQYTGELVSETSDTTTNAQGFLNAYGGAPLPSGLVLLNPTQCVQSGGVYGPVTGFEAHGCDVDVNGDGRANAAFYNTADYSAIDEQLEKKRMGLNGSFQAELGDGVKLLSDFFYTNQKSYDRQTGYQLNSATWDGATFLPLGARNTGVQVYGSYNDPTLGGPPNDFYVTPRRQFYIGDIETYSNDSVTKSQSRNFNAQLAYDRGGPFTGEVRGIYASASELHMESYLQYAISDGAIWQNDPVDALPPPVPPATYSYVVPGGSRMFNPYGFAANTIPATLDFTGDHLGIGLPPALLATLTNPNAYALKTVTSEGDHDRSADMKVLRADGHYKFSDRGVKLDFGARLSRRSADNENFALIAPVYAGLAYYNPFDPVTLVEDTSTRIPVPGGCYQHYKAADILLNGQGIAGACKAGDPTTGFFRANPLVGLNPSQLGAMVGNNTRLYNHLADVRGIGVYALDPKIMDDVLAFQNAMYPGEIRDHDPAGTWHVDVRQTTGYLQANFTGTALFPYGANVGLKVVNTHLDISQHQVGLGGAYYVNPHDDGIVLTKRSFTDVLPVANLFVDLRDNLKLRVAYAKNMQLLNLDQWGGGLTLNYAIDTSVTPAVFAVYGGQQAGNPNLDPWRSSNYDLSLEYYLGRSSMVSIAAFYVDVASFVNPNAGTTRCDLPDQDGVVRHRCVGITGPAQGGGKSLHGLEFGLKQAFDFLPGKFRNLGVDANFTYSPSNVGRDVAGNTIPFPENSREQANLILWYQDSRFEARVAGNYRSKRAVASDYGGIAGFEEYQAPTVYLDASASFNFDKHWQVFLDGSNLSGEKEKYYLVWPDMKLNTTQFESRYALGVRAKF
jgi:TonB-dependent receptor